MKTRIFGVLGISVGLFACSPNEAPRKRDAALAESRAAVAASGAAVAQAESGDPVAYAEAQAAVVRAEATLDKFERLADR